MSSADSLVPEILSRLQQRLDHLRAEANQVRNNPRIEPTKRKEMVDSIVAYRMGVREAWLILNRMYQTRKKGESNVSFRVSSDSGSNSNVGDEKRNRERESDS